MLSYTSQKIKVSLFHYGKSFLFMPPGEKKTQKKVGALDVSLRNAEGGTMLGIDDGKLLGIDDGIVLGIDDGTLLRIDDGTSLGELDGN